MNSRSAYRGVRRTRSREALLGAAEELFGEQRFGTVSIDDIVDRAGVGKGTFYNHFSGKDDIGRHLALEIRYEVRDRIAPLKNVSSDPAVHLAIAIALFLDLARVRPHRARILSMMLAGASNADAEMNLRLRGTLEAGLACGRFDFRSIEAAVTTVIGIVSAGIRDILDKRSSTSDASVSELIVHALVALGVSRDDAETVSDLYLSEALYRGAGVSTP